MPAACGMPSSSPGDALRAESEIAKAAAPGRLEQQARPQPFEGRSAPTAAAALHRSPLQQSPGSGEPRWQRCELAGNYVTWVWELRMKRRLLYSAREGQNLRIRLERFAIPHKLNFRVKNRARKGNNFFYHSFQ